MLTRVCGTVNGLTRRRPAVASVSWAASRSCGKGGKGHKAFSYSVDGSQKKKKKKKKKKTIMTKMACHMPDAHELPDGSA